MHRAACPARVMDIMHAAMSCSTVAACSGVRNGFAADRSSAPTLDSKQLTRSWNHGCGAWPLSCCSANEADSAFFTDPPRVTSEATARATRAASWPRPVSSACSMRSAWMSATARALASFSALLPSPPWPAITAEISLGVNPSSTGAGSAAVCAANASISDPSRSTIDSARGPVATGCLATVKGKPEERGGPSGRGTCTQLSSPMGAMSCSPSDAMSSTPKLTDNPVAVVAAPSGAAAATCRSSLLAHDKLLAAGARSPAASAPTPLSGPTGTGAWLAGGGRGAGGGIAFASFFALASILMWTMPSHLWAASALTLAFPVALLKMFFRKLPLAFSLSSASRPRMLVR
mmetsp:Transcript_5390/g.16320  ORF Transcript_5390/g.16320 Transcript_5390/m.16320 type:complete len:347 (+) Transcript_5390:3536-4576(+)